MLKQNLQVLKRGMLFRDPLNILNYRKRKVKKGFLSLPPHFPSRRLLCILKDHDRRGQEESET